MQQVCNQLFIGHANRPVIRQRQDGLCQAFIHSLTTDTFGEEVGTPLQTLARFLYRTFDIRNTRNPNEPLQEKSLETKLYKIAQELKEQQEDPFFGNNTTSAQKR